MKIAVIGSRAFKNHEYMKIVLMARIKDIQYYEDILIISGGAIGVDSWAEEVAKEAEVPTIIFKPDWDKYGKRAGFLRNELIINEADIVIAFWDGQSKGTKHSIDLAIKAKKPIDIYIRY